MERTHLRDLLLVTLLIPLSLLISLVIICYFNLYRRQNPAIGTTDSQLSDDPELGNIGIENEQNVVLMCFQGGEDLTVPDVLDATGEVVGKTSYSTLYRANLPRNNSILLLRFLRPACNATIEDVVPAVREIGLVRHPNLVPLRAFYVGSRGEKLLVHPYYAHGNLAQFITGQEMLEISAAQGYKAPELMKMKDVNESTDMDSLGVVLLELLTAREPINVKAVDSHEFHLPNAVRSAILNHRITDLYHHNKAVSQPSKERCCTEDKLQSLLQLAMACCSPSPSVRPHASEFIRKVEEIGK